MIAFFILILHRKYVFIFNSTMKHQIKFYIVLFFIQLFSCAFAQQMSVSTLPLNNYLPSSTVLRVHCDREGFLWLGTKDGLCRYDGYRLLVFRSGLKSPDLLTNNEITCIAENKNGYLFIGTKKGINILDKRTYQIIPVIHNDLKDQEIRTMIVDSDGWIWVGTLTSVFRCSADFSFCKRYDSTLPVTSVNSIYEDTDKNIWVTLWERGLHRYNSKTDSFIAMPHIGVLNNPFKVFQDNKKQHWILTWESGIFLLYPEEKDDLMYSHVDIKSNEHWDMNGCFSITQDDKYGYIWIVSTQGLYALQKRPGNIINTVDISHISSKLNNIFSEIVKDKSGNLWIAAFNEGVSMIDLNKPLVQNYSFPVIREKTGFVTNIKNIYEDKEGDLWIDQNRWGIGIYNPDSNKLLFYKDIPSLKNITNLRNVSCITSVPLLNEIWLGSEYYPEIYRVKKDKKEIELLGTLKLTDYVDNSGFPRLFYTDSNHNLWVGTTKGILVKPANEKILQDAKFPFVDIIGIGEGKDGSLWISTRKQGVYNAKISSDLTLEEKNLRNLKTHAEGVISDNIGAICVDDNGLVWMGSQDGDVFTYDPQTNKVENLSDMFDMLEEGIFNIITDQLGHIWISTNKRVIEYDPKNGGIMDYSTMTDVMVNSFMPNSYYKTRAGKILYGGNKGISVFTPYDHLSDNPRRIRTMVADVKIDGVSSLLEKNNQRFNLRSQIISLNAGDKNIEIDFSSLNYAFPDKIKYAYKMDGVDDDWVYVRGDRQFAFYNQLPKGKRTFYLKTTDVNGLWSNYIAEVQVFKQPAFYETLWAYLFYIVFTLLCLYLFYHRMKRRIQLRHELRIAQIDKEKSEELVQTKLRYFTNISHDLLTPLTIITCLIDDAEMTNGSRISQLTMIRSNVNKLRRLLQQILDFRKVESGNMKLSVSKSDVISFIDDVCKINFTPLMRKKNQTFTFLTEDRHLMAYFDRDKLDKIVSNLLSNACKYTANGGDIKLIVDSYWESEYHHLRIQVVDTGEGIAPADLENVFKRFYTINKGDESESNGIGLSLTKDLVELHHGTINVESELGKGSTFTVDLPINKDSYQEDELISEHISVNGINTDLILEKEELIDSKVGEGEDMQIADVHLLLVEDNEELLFLMEKILSKHYHVLIAKDGLEALNVIKDNEIDIIISDVMMPEMDGLEFCRTLKSNLETSHIPIILLTAKNTVEDRIECYNAGADGYISKPFELKILEARINNFIMHKKNKQEEFRSNVEVNIDSLEPSSMDKEFLDKVISVIKSNMSEGDFDVVQLADALAVSKSSLYRKMKIATGLSPIEFIRNIRLKHGSQLLKDKSISVAEVAYECGFSNPKYFATCFKEEFGVTPKEYQKSC